MFDKIKINLCKLYSNKKFRIFILVLLVLLGFYLRLINLYKISGFWTDEAYSFYVAKQSFPFGILDTLYNEDAHAPLYFFLLHFWMKAFGIHDLVIRLFSVLTGLIIIPVFYLLGKEMLSRKLGFAAAIFATINSFLIYYSQEVRFYCLLLLLSSLSILFLIKAFKKASLRNYICLILSNLAILYTSTIGFIFIFAEVCVYFIYILLKKRENLKNFIYSQIATLILFLPYIPFIIHQHEKYSNYFVNPFSIFMKFNYASLLLLMQNWFTPVINGIIAPNTYFYEELIQRGISLKHIVFIFIPLLISIIGIINTIIKRQKGLMILLIAILFLGIEIAMTLCGKLAITTRYAIMAFPIFFITLLYGLMMIKNRFISSLLIISIILINLLYLVFNPSSIVKKPSYEGFKTVGVNLQKLNLNKNDILFLYSKSEFLSKYYDLKKINVINLDIFMYLPNKDILNRENAHKLLRSYLILTEPPRELEDYYVKNIVNKLNNDNYFIVIFQKNAKPFMEETLRFIVLNDKIYKEVSLYFLLNSKNAIFLSKLENKYFYPVKIITERGWEIHILKKKQ